MKSEDVDEIAKNWFSTEIFLNFNPNLPPPHLLITNFIWVFKKLEVVMKRRALADPTPLPPS